MTLQIKTQKWFGKLPINWSSKKIKYGFRQIGSGTTPPTNNANYYGGTIPWVNTSELRENVITSFENMVTEEALKEFSSLKIYPPGTVLFAMYGATIGRVAILGASATLNQAVCALSEPEKFTARFVFYCLQASRIVLNSLSTGGGQPNLNAEKVRDHEIPCPNLEAQHRIADYLDRETTRIDALVVAKQRALNLLAEKRKAVIAEAVTRGLDRSVPLRESGVAWLGKIPAHWLIIPIKYGFDLIGSGTTPPTNNAEYYDGNILWVTTSELRENLVKNTQQKITELALQKFSALKVYPSGSLLFAMYGATIGRVAILGCESAVNQAVCVISQEKLFTTQFVFFALQIFRDQLIAEASGGGQPNLNAEKLKSFLLGCPFLSEQHAIVEHITRETAKLDALVATTERSIALLNERRAALISAAVTGQIPLEAMS